MRGVGFLVLLLAVTGCELVGGIETRRVVDGVNGSPSRWPDSLNARCTDGDELLDDCPGPGHAGHGQDGTYLVRVPAYQPDGDTVVDSVTGLQWEDASTNEELAAATAGKRCDDRNLAGHTDWRLPTRLELGSLMNYGSGLAFPGINPNATWTSTETAEVGTYWTGSFLDVEIDADSGKSEAFVLCVRGPPFEGSFENLGDSLRDGRTGLEWQRERYTEQLAWLDALDHCEGLDLSGSSDWRLPSAKELLTLVADDQQPAPGLAADEDGLFWSSSPLSNSPASARVIRFPEGVMGANNTTVVGYVRCVRGGT